MRDGLLLHWCGLKLQKSKGRWGLSVGVIYVRFLNCLCWNKFLSFAIVHCADTLGGGCIHLGLGSNRGVISGCTHLFFSFFWYIKGKRGDDLLGAIFSVDCNNFTQTRNKSTQTLNPQISTHRISWSGNWNQFAFSVNSQRINDKTQSKMFVETA